MLALGAVLTVAAVVIAVRYGDLGGPPPPVLPPDSPPEGVQLVYDRNPTNAHGLIAYDWNGTRRGSLKLPTWVPIGRLRPAPDGSGFMLDPASAGDYAAYFDRTGRTLFETNDEGFLSQAWADDGDHVCVFTDNPGPELVVRRPGEGDRAAQVPVDARFTLVACSVRSDLAVFASTDEVLVARLSTGAVLRRSSLPAGGSVLASTDAAYVAVSALETEPVTVYATSDLKKAVARLDAGLVPLAFSGDDSMLLAGQASGSGPLQGLDWRAGKVAWTYGAGTANVEMVLARPAAPDFAIYAGATLAIVRRDGRAVQIG